ncbi:hypothetical protein IV203_008218 [Nitzschia inconspicua]|uniref:Uncharacterized protein n=1 Tax=Nitzschia inconspicua TaxID=303405 RepID=A0A9K3KZY4_9STRA|nr:hypothetical protein IV203_008218 [Nitzschia inconspicua]
MIEASFIQIETNNEGCKLLNEDRTPHLAVVAFQTVLASFRRTLDAQLRPEGNSVRSPSTASAKLLPLTPAGALVLRDALAFKGGNHLSVDRKWPSRQAVFLHEKAFAMSSELSFSHNEKINYQLHLVVTLFNLGLCFHLMGKQENNAGSSSTRPRGFFQARALYSQALQLLQECLDNSSCWRQCASSRPQGTGNELVDLLLLALLNNTAVVCCIDLGQHSSQHSFNYWNKLDARNVSFVKSFSSFVDALKDNKQNRLHSFPLGLKQFSRNVHQLNGLFFRGSAAAAA